MIFFFLEKMFDNPLLMSNLSEVAKIHLHACKKGVSSHTISLDKKRVSFSHNLSQSHMFGVALNDLVQSRWCRSISPIFFIGVTLAHWLVSLNVGVDDYSREEDVWEDRKKLVNVRVEENHEEMRKNLCVAAERKMK